MTEILENLEMIKQLLIAIFIILSLIAMLKAIGK